MACNNVELRRNALFDVIRNLCLQMAPPQVILDKILCLHEWPSVKCQDLLAQNCLVQFCHNEIDLNLFQKESNEIFGKYYPSKQWLKCLIKKIEQSILKHSDADSEEIFSDLFMQIILSNQNVAVDADDTAYVIYPTIIGENFCPLRVRRSHNQVGTKVWEAGLFLAETLLHSSVNFTGKNIVELGAGVGVTGILFVMSLLAAKNKSGSLPAKFVLTDFDTSVLDNLTHNIAINFPAGQAENSIPLTAQCLDWSSLTKEDVLAIDAHILLAADCTYSEDINCHLVRSIELFLHHAKACATGFSTRSKAQRQSMDFHHIDDLMENSVPFALIACTIRNVNTFNDFVQKIVASSWLSFMDATDWARSVAPEQFYYYENRDSIRLLCIEPVSSSDLFI